MSISDAAHVSKGAPVAARRIEVYTGAGRRRDWDPEQKASIVAESYAGDVCVMLPADIALRPRRWTPPRTSRV